MNDRLRRAIEHAVAAPASASWERVGATGWGEAWRLIARGQRRFVKCAGGSHAALIGTEADGLRAIAATRTIRVPQVIASGSEDDVSYVVLEWLDMRESGGGSALGRALARLHGATAARGPHGERFGWHRDNWIGASVQTNGWIDDWPAFFRDRRLAPQLALAARSGFDAIARDGQRLLDAVPAILAGHAPSPSLVHGDLWAGNAATLADGDGVVFDPAVYVGDREVDLAMTELFGGFDRTFYDAYDAAWPRPQGHALRRDLYNLYHLLNHVNLFGGGYVARTRQVLTRLLARVS